ncbi:hypothetical protein J7K55_05805 [Candidatus Aerophobetes bacterium]|nr:hypothetical protein [Candidatus Aerophobetes bacterium]
MGLGNIIKSIEMKSSQEIDKIKKEANKEREKILIQAEKEADKIKNEIKKRFKKEGEDEKKKRVIRARSKEKREILNLKRELINEVFKLAEKEISSLNKEEYLTLLKNSLFANIDSGDKEIVFSPEDKRLIEGEFINNLKNREKRIKISYGLDKKERGFIIIKEEMQINRTFSNFFSFLREELEIEVARRLFE